MRKQTVRRRQELDSVIREALKLPEISEALRELEIDPTEAGREIAKNPSVIVGFNVTRSQPLSGATPSTGVTFGRGRDSWLRRRTPATRLGVAAAFLVAYLTLFLLTVTKLNFYSQLLTVVGLATTLTMAVRLAMEDAPMLYRAFQRAQNAETWSRASLHDVVLPELRQYIDGQRELTYSTELFVGKVRLDEQDDTVPTVITAAGAQLRRTVARSNTAAIALAGHRGTGKTTTIGAVADGLFSDNEAPFTLNVIASAPSRYDARDFVLHLHAMLCKKIIRLTGFLLGLPTTPEPPAQKSHARRLLRKLAWLLPITAIFAAVAVVSWGTPFRDAVRELPHVVWTVLGDDSLTPEAWHAKLAIAFAILAAIFGLLTVFAIAIDLVVWFLSVLLTTARAFAAQQAEQRHPGTWALRRDAVAELQRIRFLQTFTTGWSGKIGLPLNVELSRTDSVQRAEQNLTYPEVVENFRQFAGNSATTLIRAAVIDRLVIAIDELDKIAKPEEAHEFVNDIKGIFGVPNCLFVVSVSEDAMSSFERRGLPIRDAFDSAFTHLVRMDNFTQAESRRWLARRLIGVPEQFVWLVHCLSGGLPRELRRATVELVDIIQESGHGDLESVTAGLLNRELERKSHAFVAAARQFEDSHELSDYLACLVSIPSCDTPDAQFALADRLKPSGEITELHRIRWQSACFVRYCATMRTVFVNTLDMWDLDERVDTLARARAQLAIDPQLAWRLVESVHPV